MALALTTWQGAMRGSQAMQGGQPSSGAVSPHPSCPWLVAGAPGSCSRITEASRPQQLFQKTVPQVAEAHSILLEWMLCPGWLRIRPLLALSASCPPACRCASLGL